MPADLLDFVILLLFLVLVIFILVVGQIQSPSPPPLVANGSKLASPTVPEADRSCLSQAKNSYIANIGSS